MNSQVTADELEEGIANAIAAHDFEAAIDMVKVLLTVDMDRGAQVYGDIQLGIELGRRGLGVYPKPEAVTPPG